MHWGYHSLVLSLQNDMWCYNDLIYIIFSIFFSVSSVHGARKVDVKKRYAEGMERYASWRARRDAGDSDPAPSTEDILGLEDGEHLSESTEITTATGTIKEKLVETYDGVPVFGQSVVVELDNGEPTGEISGHLVEGIEEDIPDAEPALSEEEAIEIAAESWGHEMDDILDGSAEAQLLVYVPDDDNSPDVIPVLAYELSYMVMEDGEASRPSFIVDANTGETIRSWDGLTSRTTDQVEGRGYYEFHALGGNPKMGKLRYGEDLPALRIWMDEGMCYLHNEKVTVVDGSSYINSYNDSYSFPCEQGFNDSINGAYSPLADGFFFGSMAYDVFNEWLGVPPLTFKVVMVVHYGNMMENAFWDGQVTSFGDGYSMFYPLVVLDVVAHEMAHGFTEQHSGLIYNGMSGGMNEAFSDIAGGAAEAYMKESDWLLGENAFKAENEALRYFIDPTLDGRSLGHMDDYCQPVDVHYNSGIYNRAWYLLTITPGWNVRMSFQVMATANQLYWTPDSTFNDGACGVMQAARDLGYNDADVEAAFNGVGILPCGPSISGMFSLMDISGVEGETLYYYFDLEDEINVMKFETYGSYWSGEYTMTVETPSGRILSTSTISEALHVLDPDLGTYIVTLSCESYFSGVDLYAIGGTYILADYFEWESGKASGSFEVPQSVVDAQTAASVRAEFYESEIFAEPPFFMVSHEGEVDIDSWIGDVSSETRSNGKRMIAEALLCKAKAGTYNYELSSWSDIPEGLHLILERIIMPSDMYRAWR